MHATLTMAVRALENAAENLVFMRNEIPKRKEDASLKDDFIAHSSKGAANRVAKRIREAFPHHGVNCDQFGVLDASEGMAESANIEWHLNILTGESNFIQGLPEVGVCLVQTIQGRPEHAVIQFPFLDLIFSASKGRGAQLNEGRIRVSKRDRLAGAMVGLPQAEHEAAWQLQQQFTSALSHIRVSGTSLLDLCRVAAGQLDLAYADQLTSTQMSAIGLILAESGGITGNLKGAPTKRDGELLATNSRLFKSYLQMTRKSA